MLAIKKKQPTQIFLKLLWKEGAIANKDMAESLFLVLCGKT